MKLLPALVLASGLLASCSGGSSGTPAATADVLVTETSSTSLSAFSAGVRALFLERADGTRTDNLLAGPSTVELMGLDGEARWLGSIPVGADTYRAVHVEFEPSAYQARDASGTVLAVSSVADSARMILDTLVTVAQDDHLGLEVAIDVDDSTTLFGGAVVFDPSARVQLTDSGSSSAIDEFDARVLSFEAASSTIVAEAFTQNAPPVSLGVVTIELVTSAVLVDDNGVPFADRDAFFAVLAAGTILEVHGALTGSGVVRADRVEVEDDFGGAAPIRIEGRVVALDPGTSLELRIVELEKGAALAQPVLTALGNPSSITVALTPATRYELDDGTPTTVDALAVGREVEVRFATFDTEPFPAVRVELEDVAPELEAFVTDTTELPARMTVRLKNSDPALLAGLVASSQTPVIVELGGATVAADFDDEPTVGASALLDGMEVKIYGTLNGTPSAPTVDAARVEIRLGRLDEATVVSAGTNSFLTIGGEIDDPFGGGLSAGPLEVVLEPGAELDGDFGSLAALRNALESGAAVEVRVEGIGATTPNVIRGYEVDFRVDD